MTEPGGAPSAAAGWTVRYLWIVGGLTVLHAVLAATLPITGDEAYYWDCSRHPDWTYFDQPPLVIWTMIPFRMLLGETALAVRSPAILSGLLLALFLVPLIRRLGGGMREATYSYLLLHAMPLYFVGAFYESTDVGMVTAWAAATWAAVALAKGEQRAWWGFGAACGLGFLAKFPVILVAPALTPALLRPEVRAQLRTPTPYLAGLFSLLLTAPIWIWGALHDWDNIVFQLYGRHTRSQGFTLEHLGAFIGGNLALATPFLCFAMFIALWRSRDRRGPGWSSLRVAMLMPFVAFGLISIFKHVGLHWGSPGLLLGTVVLVLVPFAGRRVWIGLGAIAGLTSSLLIVLIALFPEAAFQAVWVERSAPGDKPPRILTYPIGNDELLREVMRRRLPDEVVISQSYSLVHLLGFWSGGELPTALARVTSGVHGLASLYWYPPEHWQGIDAMFVTDRENLEESIAARFAACEPDDPILVTRDGREIRRFRVLRCTDLKQPVPAFSRLSRGP